MSAGLRSFQSLIRQIRSDSMLYMFSVLPLLIASIFRFGIPYLETTLCNAFHTQAILSPYYLLFDLFLAAFTPYIIVLIAALVMLTEIDDHIAVYLSVTPIQKKGYLISRLLFPSIISLVFSIVLMLCCSLSIWSFGIILLICFLSVLLCIPIAMLIVVYSHNRVEGMAIAKLSALLLFGLIIPFFLKGSVQYLFFWLPSFWLSKAVISSTFPFAFLSLFASLLWIALLYKRFERKLL